MIESLGHLEHLDPRTVWLHEAHGFTPWLLDNSKALSDALGIDLELTSAEHPVGGFALDLIGRDLTNNCVLIVENQLTSTDHGHLGQLLTYAAGTEAGTIVWLATRFREEHRQALDFLNDLAAGRVRFFGVQIEVVRIGLSAPAPLFSLQAQPNDWHSAVAADAKTTSSQVGKAPLYVAFWTRFLERMAVERPSWSNARKPQPTNWMQMPRPFKGLSYYSPSFAQGGKLRNELYLDFTDPKQVSDTFDKLSAHKDLIESTYGGELTWEPLPGKRAARIGDFTSGSVTNGAEFEGYIDWFFDSGDRLRAAMQAGISQLGSETALSTTATD